MSGIGAKCLNIQSKRVISSITLTFSERVRFSRDCDLGDSRRVSFRDTNHRQKSPSKYVLGHCFAVVVYVNTVKLLKLLQNVQIVKKSTANPY